MTDQWTEICQCVIHNRPERHNPVYLFGSDREKVRAALDVLSVGYSLVNPQEHVFETNCTDFTYHHKRYVVGDNDLDTSFLRDYRLIVVEGPEWATIASEDAKILDKILGKAFEDGKQVLIGSCYPPSDVASFSEQMRERILSGRVHCVDAESIAAPLDEIAKAGISLPGEKGRFAELYKSEYLHLFSTEPSEALSDEQNRALKEMQHYISKRTRESRDQLFDLGRKRREIGFFNYGNPEDFPADMLEFIIIYAFWNRMWSFGDRYEVIMAKSGELGRYLRALKKRDGLE